MAATVTERLWEIGDIVTMLEKWEMISSRGTKVYLSLQHEDVRMIQGPYGVKGLTVEGE